MAKSSAKYDLTVKHNDTDCGDFCIYQTYDNQMEDIRPLVWFSKTEEPAVTPAPEQNIVPEKTDETST